MGSHAQGRRTCSGKYRNNSNSENREEPEMAEKKSVQDLLVEEIKDLYSAEKQLTKAIPKMAKGSSGEALQQAFSSHLKETEQQVQRLEQVGQLLGVNIRGKKCMGMEGCIQEGAEMLEEEGEENILDLGLIGAGTRVEHYEMAGYMTAISLAQRLRHSEVVELLNASLAEEQAADKKLRAIGAELLKAAPAEAVAKGRA
jgi:ferritin-like metal-binding protein YciE